MSTWKSSLLDKLNVGAVTSTHSGPTGLVKGLVLAATVAVGLGAMSNDAYGEQLKREAPTGFVKAFKTILHADDLILDPLREKALGQLVSPETLKVTQEVAETQESSIGGQAFDIATTAVAAGAAAPALGAWMLLKQADRTYEYVQDRQMENVNLKMAEVSQRTSRVYEAEIARMRAEDERKKNPEMFADLQKMQENYDNNQELMADSKPASALEQSNASAASADLQTSTANLDALFEKGNEKALDRSSELSR